MAKTEMELTAAQHEQCGRALFNQVWTLLEKPDRTEHETDLMIHACHASWLHWSKVPAPPANGARGEWQLSRVYAAAGQAGPALHHAERCLKICRDHGIGDFDLAFAFEAVARAQALRGNREECARHVALAEEAGRHIAGDDDRKLLFDDLRTVPDLAPAARAGRGGGGAGAGRPAPRLFRVILPVSDIDAAQVFYHRVLGLPGERVSPGRHYFDCGGTILACYDPRADGDGFVASPNPDHVYLAVSDLEETRRRSAEAGCLWLEDGIRTRPWGERSFYLKDPFGNPVCFVDEGTEFAGWKARDEAR